MKINLGRLIMYSNIGKSRVLGINSQPFRILREIPIFDSLHYKDVPKEF